MHEITPELLKKIVPTLPLAKRKQYAPLIQQACIEFDITNEPRVAAFISQVAHESAHFNTFVEYASGAAYDRRKDLGNTKPEAIAAAQRNNTTPGRFYKGHGAIQTTGYSNHKETGDFLGVNAVENPAILATPEYAFRAAGYYWDKHNLNLLADRRRFKELTKRINGGYNGLEDRLRYYERALAALPDDFKLTENAEEVDADAMLDVTREEAAADAEKGVTTSTKSPDETEGTPPPTAAAEVKASQPSLTSRITSFGMPAGVLTTIGAIWKFAQNIPPWGWGVLGGIFVVAVLIGAWLYNESMKRAQRRTELVINAAADKDKNNLRLI